jgi:signal transduction histidine kinase
MTTLPTRILVTDDDTLALSAACRVLTSAGYDVISAINGEQTLQMVEEHHPDVMLLDVVLPDIDGTEICRRIKADPRTADIFIILLSGIRTSSDEQSQGMEGGADGFIARPIANRELLARIQAYLRVKIAEQRLREYSEHLEEAVKERTRELCDAQERLVRHEKLSVLGQMASSVGHELRNPLAVINSSVYYLKLVQPDADDMIKKHLGIIEKEVWNSEKIITDLLDFARIKSVDRKAVSVSDLIRQTLERFPAPESVEVTLEIPTDLPRIFVDPRQMIQVLGNITVNAYQAMKDGGKLTVSSRQSSVKAGSLITDDSSLITDNWILITVKDSGVGIPPENMGKLFEPLFTTKTKGIGLGLAVSKKLTEANGGRIEVESEVGVGSTFTVWLPVN